MKLSSITDVTPSKLLYYKSLDYYYTSLSGSTYIRGFTKFGIKVHIVKATVSGVFEDLKV